MQLLRAHEASLDEPNAQHGAGLAPDVDKPEAGLAPDVDVTSHGIAATSLTNAQGSSGLPRHVGTHRQPRVMGHLSPLACTTGAVRAAATQMAMVLQ